MQIPKLTKIPRQPTDGGTIDGRDSTDDQAAHALGVVVKALVNESKAQNQEKPALTRDQKKNDHGH